jgi:uncharacterized protein (TIGR02466 family)
MSTTITPLFCSPLYHTNIKAELNVQEVDAVFNNINLDKQGLMIENIGNKFTSDQNILNANQNITIYEAIKKHVDIYFYELLRAEKDIEIYITQSWINKSAPGDYHQVHTHPNSFISGTFYYKTNANAGQLTFADPKYTPLEYRKQEHTAFNSNLWKVIPSEYDLILFPSYILHGVGINNSSGTRLSLAFNTYLKGIINNKPTTSLALN